MAAETESGGSGKQTEDLMTQSNRPIIPAGARSAEEEAASKAKAEAEQAAERVAALDKAAEQLRAQIKEEILKEIREARLAGGSEVPKEAPADKSKPPGSDEPEWAKELRKSLERERNTLVHERFEGALISAGVSPVHADLLISKRKDGETPSQFTERLQADANYAAFFSSNKSRVQAPQAPTAGSRVSTSGLPAAGDKWRETAALIYPGDEYRQKLFVKARSELEGR
jgi:hypothetical protein